jgi:hypothetical protein
LENSDQYRYFARECLKMARLAADERSRSALIHMAQVWARLAEEKANAG